MVDMTKYMACICGWVSEEYPDDYMFMSLGGILDCPICHAKQQNATLEGCHGHVTVVTLEELQGLYEQVGHGIEWEQAFRNLQRERLILEKPIHCHLAWFGSELACPECNPVCHQNHEMNNPNHLQWCGEEDCPMGPKKMSERMKNEGPMSKELKKVRDAWEKTGISDWRRTAKKLEKPVLLTTPFFTGEDGKDDFNATMWEDKEDKIRKNKRKSIRIQGKYGHARGKEKKREP